MADALDLSGLPGAELVEQGLQDITRGQADTVEALLVWIAASRLRALGLPVPEPPPSEEDFELTLYRQLVRSGAEDPFSDYNALLRRLVSFARAADHRRAS